MPDISKLWVNGTEYDIKDAETRHELTQKANESDVETISVQIASLMGAVGSPLVAATVAAMTDHTKIYVYTGSETGYTAGNWYYWDSSLATPAWTSGGVYNSTAFTTDTTLSVSGMAADAKATGQVRDQILRNNSYDILAPLTKAGRTHQGITFTWDANNAICHISGTATGDAFDSFIADRTALPAGMEAGKTYQLVYSDSDVYVDTYYYDANDTQSAGIQTKTNKAVTIPSDAVGFAIRFRVPSGKTVDTYVFPKLLTEKSNAALDAEIAQTNTDMEDMEARISENIPIDVAGAWSTPTRTNAGVTYTYSDGQYTVSGTSTGNPSINNLYYVTNALPSGITAGMLMLVKYSSISVALRFSWYGSGGTVIQRDIMKSETLVKVPADAVGVLIRMEVAKNTVVNETINYPVALSGVTTDYLYNEIEEMKAEAQDNKRSLKVLIFGSSYTYSTLGYLPVLMNEAAPNLNFTMGIMYISGGGLDDHIDYFNEQTPYDTYSEYTTVDGKYTNSNSEYTSQDILSAKKWDVIVLQQNRRPQRDTVFSEIETFADLVVGYIAGLDNPYPVEFLLNIPQARGAANDPVLLTLAGNTTLEKSNTDFASVAAIAEWAKTESLVIRDVLPSGTAVQNFRNATDTSNIGAEGSGYLCDDANSHLENGIGPLVAGYAAMIKLLDYTGEPPKSFAIPLEPTNSWMNSIDYQVRSSHGSCVGVTDENRLLGQKCAVAANKSPFELWNFSA